MPQMLEDCVRNQIFHEGGKVARSMPHERVHSLNVEPIIEVPVPQILQEGVEIASLMPRERVHQRTVEQPMDVPVPQIFHRMCRGGEFGAT